MTTGWRCAPTSTPSAACSRSRASPTGARARSPCSRAAPQVSRDGEDQASARVARGDRRLAVRRAARANADGEPLVRPARQPPDGAHLQRHARAARRDRPDRGQRPLPAPAGRLVPGAPPALGRGGRPRPPRAHGRRRLRPVQARGLRAPADRRARRNRRRSRAQPAPLPAGARPRPRTPRRRGARASTRCGPRRRAGIESTSAAASACCWTGSSTAWAPAGARRRASTRCSAALEARPASSTLLLGEGFRASEASTERATEKALESSAEVVVIHHHDLGPHDGIAALLRY